VGYLEVFHIVDGPLEPAAHVVPDHRVSPIVLGAIKLVLGGVGESLWDSGDGGIDRNKGRVVRSIGCDPCHCPESIR
jgi:hypothetical protein